MADLEGDLAGSPLGRRTDRRDVHARILKIIATSGFLAALECIKFFFGRGSAPNSAPQTP